MEKEPQFRKKHEAKSKKKDKGFIYANKRHVRIELENLQRHEKKILKIVHEYQSVWNHANCNSKNDVNQFDF